MFIEIFLRLENKVSKLPQKEWDDGNNWRLKKNLELI